MINFWEDKNLEPALHYAKKVTKHYAKSFYISAQMLPKEKRLATYGIYAFCRYADNIVDNPRDRSNQEINIELDNLRDELKIAFKSGESENPALAIFVPVMLAYQIPQEYAFDMIEGVRMDLNLKRYQDFEQLYLFCYRVAAVVGLMMTHILGYDGKKETLYQAELMGVAMQLTNILRDVQEDAKMDRIYLPKDALMNFGVDEMDLLNNKFTPELKNLMKMQVERAKKYYKDGEIGVPNLHKDTRFAIYSAAKIYSGILDKIIENDYNPFLGRVYVPQSKKIAMLASEYFRNLLK